MPSCCGAPVCDLPAATPAPPSPLPTATAPVIPVTPTALAVAARSGAAGKVVALDPGHGGIETGAVANNGLAEKDVNLRIALELAVMLRSGGFVPVLTRNSDRRVNISGRDLNGDGVVNTDDDLQARVDIANAAHADILISIHNNGSADSSMRGTTIYYCDARPFSGEDIKLAASLRTHIVGSIRAAGYNNSVDRGISDDAPLKKPFGHLFLLGPLTPRMARVSNMPGALGETLYLSNPTEAAWLARDSMIAAIARGYYDGIVGYFSAR
jgi:N-acetylmuramoyl-L-alanine amidase